MKKTCKLCKIEKDVAEFYKHPDTKDRLDARCKECLREAARNLAASRQGRERDPQDERLKKTCSRCQQEKDTTEFDVARARMDGLTYQCKECRSEWHAGHYRQKCQRVRATAVCTVCGVEKPGGDFVAGMDLCKPCQAAKSRAWAAANPETVRRYWLMKNFGLTLEEYAAMLARQGGVCAICRQPETKVYKKSGRVANLAVDHAHDGTGRIRSLLCSACNVGLGSFRDDTALLVAALEYLRSHALKIHAPEQYEPFTFCG